MARGIKITHKTSSVQKKTNKKVKKSNTLISNTIPSDDCKELEIIEESSQYWLIKSEPDDRIHNGVNVRFSIDDLERLNISPWDGVRNYEARNTIRDKMKMGDICLFYHSNCKVPGIAGIATVCSESYHDPSAFDRAGAYYDPKSDSNKPIWFAIDVKFQRKLNRLIPLTELKTYHTSELSKMFLLNRGRLSVQPVTKSEFEFIMSLE